MMDEVETRGAVPIWFWILAGLALLFEVFGCYSYLTDVMRSAEALAALPLDQRAMMQAMPPWIYAAYATAVWAGLAGAVLLLMRRKLAEPLLLVSLIAVVVQFGGVLLVPKIREVTPDGAFTAPIIIFVICYGIYMLARLSRKRGWLR